MSASRNNIDFQTPSWVCREMVSMLPLNAVSILEPTPGVGNLVRELGGYKVTAPDDFWSISGRFDAVVMNPPFSPMSEGYRILFRCMEMAGFIVALMPWLTIINSQKRTDRIISWGLRSVTHLPRSVFKGSRVQCCILEMENGYRGDAKLNQVAERLA